MRGIKWHLIIRQNLTSIKKRLYFVALIEGTMPISWRWVVVNQKY
jgi:hypothetical protein